MKNLKKLTFIFLLSHSLSPFAIDFTQCENIFLEGKNIDHYIKDEQSKEKDEQDAKYLSKLVSLKSSKNCFALLQMALLKDNGLLEERSLLASDLLQSFIHFHSKWITPKDLDQPKSCSQKYQWDVFDQAGPAYHMTKTLFQKGKEASQILLSYGEPRIVRKGEDPTVSPKTGLSSADYKKSLKLENDLTFTGNGEILGFLFEKTINTSQFILPKENANAWKEKMPFQNEHNIFQHFGAGILGSPSFLYHYLKKRPFFESDGKRVLPRNLSDAIFKNLLCSTPDEYFQSDHLSAFQGDILKAEKEEKLLPWKHPITTETNCQSCHFPMDQLAAGFRNLSLIPSAESCSEDQIQLLYPVFLKADHSQEFWVTEKNNDKSKTDFSSSYAEGFFKGKRFRNLRQLGSLIAEDPNFYSCQVKRYYQWIHNSYPKSQVITELTQKYQSHKDGLSLLKDIIALEVP